MSTVQQRDSQVITEEAPSVLDQAIENTGRIQSIRNTAAQFLGVPPARVCDLLRNVWRTSKDQPPLTDAEMFMGMSMVARFGLDPIAKEVYVTRSSKGLITVIGIDGWVKILNRVDDFDGFEQTEEWDDKGNLICVETRIYTTKRKRPTTYRGYAKEYSRMAGIVAEKMPWHMLRVFSLRHAARLFTPVGGSVVTEEEARWMDAYAQLPEEGRTRQNTLKDKVTTAAIAAKEFEQMFDPIPQVEVIPEVKPEVIQDAMQKTADQFVSAEPQNGPSEAQIVQKYKDRIEGCESLKGANRLVSAASNDVLIPKCCSAHAIKYIGELLQGNVTRWRQTSKQTTLIP